ncbi:response regulator with putative antiterminator output domain [Mycolicibacterium gilvum]|uniref:Response regulator with putative antiterminator output domain n=1 Tax=Mycolicibacterium gilvum TaxID=1804 RepID=A0A378SF03_9MYCO|nr:response regulator with putative antiterminator output domain [Mycolicibacterium gilvum]
MTRMTASPDRHHLARRMAELARALAQRTVEDVLIDVTTAAKEMIPGVDVAGVLLVGKDATHQTLATTDDLMFELDTLQMETGEGPCLHAALDEVMVRTDDFRAEPRFPPTRPRSSTSVCSARCRSSSTPPSAPRGR